MSPDSPTNTQVAELRESVPSRDSESSNSSSESSKNHALSGVLKRKPSISQILTRVRSTSGSSINSHRSSETVRPTESIELPEKSPSNFPSPESPSTKSQHLSGLALWDRTVDVVYHQYPRGASRPNRSLNFDRSLGLFMGEHGRKQVCAARGYFALPSALRFRIWQYVMEADPDDRPVALTIARWNRDAWRQGEFLNLRQAMKGLQSSFEVSFQFRADALVSFLMTKRFHITYSPCIRPLLNPIATKWADKYSPYMQDIAPEVVLTEYRFGMNPSAHLLAPATTKLEDLIGRFVQAQLKKRSISTLRSFVILCRRFYGRRRARSRPHSTEVSAGKKGLFARDQTFFWLIRRQTSASIAPTNTLPSATP